MKKFFIALILLFPIMIYADDDPKTIKISVSSSANISATIMEPVTTAWLQEKTKPATEGGIIRNFSLLTICEKDSSGQEFEVTVLNCE